MGKKYKDLKLLITLPNGETQGLPVEELEMKDLMFSDGEEFKMNTNHNTEFSFKLTKEELKRLCTMIPVMYKCSFYYNKKKYNVLFKNVPICMDRDLELLKSICIGILNNLAIDGYEFKNNEEFNFLDYLKSEE